MKETDEIIFGIRAIMEGIQSGKEIEKVFLQKDAGGKSTLFPQLTRLLRENNIPTSYVPIQKLNKICRKNHQGAVAVVSPVAYASLDFIINSAFSKGESPLLLILDGITDVRNFGGIARSAECLGANAIIIPLKGAAQINSEAMKTSAGALHYIPVCKVKSLGETAKSLKDHGFQIVACTEKASDYIKDIDFSIPTAIVMGSEESGIQPLVLKESKTFKIPMSGKISSLNVANASSIILYEMMRQRTNNDQ